MSKDIATPPEPPDASVTEQDRPLDRAAMADRLAGAAAVDLHPAPAVIGLRPADLD